MKKILMTALVASAAWSANALAAPINVTQTTSGSAGNFTYNFTFDNEVGQGQYLYYLGVRDITGTITSSPSPLLPNAAGVTVDGTTYNLVWLAYGDPSTGIASGQQLSGFVIHDTSSVAQASFQFFGKTYAHGAVYTGGENTGGTPQPNPFFTGFSVASQSAAPEPASWAMMIAGFGAIGAGMRRRKVAISFA